jgi:hypothetical protein
MNRGKTLVAWLTLGLVGPVAALERLEPPEGCYFGVNVGERDTIGGLASRLGITPSVYVQFFHFPLTTESRGNLIQFLADVRTAGAIALLTLEPFQGLPAVTDAAGRELTALCATNEAQGIGGILVRFAHEMNGNWYPWCQEPILYKQKFQLLSRLLRTNTVRTAMLWAPHNGIGYPFSTTGLYQAANGSPEFAALDTNRDGRLTSDDDMYEPYYPGDDVVDWVGMTIYHWGFNYPWLENEMPAPGSFAATLRGTGHQPPIPDFYARYCSGVHNKPLVIPETSAFYNPHQPAGPGEFAIKQAWWRQLFNISGDSNGVDIATHFPKLKCINWFDHYKPESEAQGNWIDWRISAHLPLRSAFVEHLRALRDGRPYFLTAQEFHWLQAPFAIVPEHLPAIVPLTGEITVSLRTRAASSCDLVVDLLDESYRWVGGTRVPITTGTNAVVAGFSLVERLVDGRRYRWSIFLTPTGSNYLHALSWYNGVHPVARAAEAVVAVVACPPVLSAGSNAVIRVKYAVAPPALLQVQVMDGSSNRVGEARAQLSRRHGYLDIPVASAPTFSVGGDGWIEAVLLPLPPTTGALLARSGPHPVVIDARQGNNSINVVPEPGSIPQGDVFRFTVGYSAANDCDLHVDLFDANTNFLIGAVQRVGRGSGIQDMTISLPQAHAGRYFANGFMTPVGPTFTQALAWSAPRRIEVVAPEYTEWSASVWGVLFATDLSHPQEDPDGDQMSNWEEFSCLTDPRDATKRLQLEVAVVGQQLEVSWLSSLGRSYQLLESDSLNEAPWNAVGGLLAGTGGQLKALMTLPAQGVRKFYRLQVLRP